MGWGPGHGAGQAAWLSKPRGGGHRARNEAPPRRPWERGGLAPAAEVTMRIRNVEKKV